VPSNLSCDSSWGGFPQDLVKTYWYDGADNWQRRGLDQGSDTMSVGLVNELLGFGGQGATNDLGGNATAVGTTAYVHDGLGRLIETTRGTTTLRYRHDAMGRRTTVDDGSSTTYTVWDGDQLLATASATGSAAPSTTAYTLRIGAGLDRHLALYERATGRVRYLHQGPDESVLALTDTSGLLEGYVYTAFGETTILGPAGITRTATAHGNRLMFQGQLHDPQLDGYWMRSREYQPSLGRFLAQDPIGLAGGLNLYSFVGGRPLTHRDPSGHEARRAATADSYLEPAGIGDSMRALDALPAFYDKFHLVDALSFPYVYTDDPDDDRGVPDWFENDDRGLTGVMCAGPCSAPSSAPSTPTTSTANRLWSAYYQGQLYNMAVWRGIVGPRTVSFGVQGSGAFPGLSPSGGYGAGLYVDLAKGDVGFFHSEAVGLTLGLGGPGFGFALQLSDDFNSFAGESHSLEGQVGWIGGGQSRTLEGSMFRPTGSQFYVGMRGLSVGTTKTTTFPYSVSHWFVP
jgi:RHS repeat-associated protein